MDQLGDDRVGVTMTERMVLMVHCAYIVVRVVRTQLCHEVKHPLTNL